MASEYEKKRPAFLTPAAENTYPTEPASTWTPAQYEPWNYSSRAESLPPPGLESNNTHQQQQQNDQSTSAAAAPLGSQPWLGYYPSQRLQQGGQAPTNQGPPPLPSVPPPQPPPPPEPSTSLPSWSSVVAGGTESRVADGAGFSYPNYYNHQQQNVQESNYGGQDGQVNNGSGSSSSSSVTPSNVTANGSANYGQSYPGYTPATGDQYAYGSSGNYAGYNYGYPQQQGNDSYSQNMGPPYQNSGAAPYPPVSSFPSTSSYTDSTSYQSTGTYYNAGVYQNTGGYPASGYSGHPNSWSENNYGNSYGAYPGYGGYPAGPDQNHTVESGAVQNANHYQQDYQPQWENYYASNQSNTPASSDNAPGTAPSTTPPPSYASVVAQGPGGMSQPPASSQPPPPGTQPSWQPNTPPFGSSSQANPAMSKMGNIWDAPKMQNSQGDPHRPILQNHFQVGLPQEVNLGNLKPQPPAPTHFQQGPPPQPPPGQHVQTQQAKLETPHGHGFQSSGPPMMKPGPQWRSGKIQIPTNPRIAPSFVGKGNPGQESTQKPAYTSVGARTGKLSSDDVTDATLQPGMFPSSLKAYVERALARCKDESQKSACQDIMKEMITAASRDGSLFTRDWDTEPLFPLPSMPSTSTGKEILQRANAGISGFKPESSPNKRMKSRWEPVGEEESEDRHGHGTRDTSKDSVRNRLKERDNSVSPPKWEKREGNWNRIKSVQQQKSHLSLANRFQRGSKRGRRISGLGFNGAGSSSESEDETDTSGLGGVILGSLITAETPEERKRRQSRTKRFDRGKDANVGLKTVGKVRPGGTASARRATAEQLVRNYGDGNGHAVEDIDWDSLTVKGTCQEIEKRYLRLTSAPDPSTVRPEEVLKKALAMVQSTPKGYLFRCEQLKSIRQDLTVQRIRDEFTVEVYETHARMALESGDLPEYNQCQTQLKGLYAEGIKGCSNEFTGYSLLFIIFNHGNSRDLLSTMARLSKEARNDAAVKHALAVRAAVSLGNYTTFFKLYRTAPNLSPYLMDKHVEKMRFEAVKCMTRSYRPSLPVSFIARTLGFSGIVTLGGEEKEIDGVDDCDEWLRSHGAQVNFDSTANELVLDTKMSAMSLFMPEPEDVVPHGDANLGLNDFFSARS
ncbi:unnamed protein product [Calypogeia fissa]